MPKTFHNVSWVLLLRTHSCCSAHCGAAEQRPERKYQRAKMLAEKESQACLECLSKVDKLILQR
eukprot:3248222-Rhodomonas_salina.9